MKRLLQIYLLSVFAVITFGWYHIFSYCTINYLNSNIYLGQTTTQSSSYTCPVSDVTAQFSAVTSTYSHSALNIQASCSIAQCQSTDDSCRNSQTPCFNYQTQNNVGYCGPAVDCSILQPCNDTCSSNQSVCVMNTCCQPAGRCLPLYLTTLCPMTSKFSSFSFPIVIFQCVITVGWSLGADMIYARGGHTSSVLPNGKVLVTGGNGYNDVQTSCELYDPSSKLWTTTGDLTFARSGHMALILLNGKVLVFGGRGANAGDLDSAELYDPSTGTWSTTGNMSSARPRHTASVLSNGKVLIAGGCKPGSYMNSVELYDPTTGSCSITGN